MTHPRLDRRAILVRTPAIIAGAAVVLALAACSGQTSKAASSAPTHKSTGTASSPSPAAQGHKSSAPSKPHATEFNPPGDIPDNQVFVDYRAPGSRVHIRVPEGWPRSIAHGSTTFTDKYNSITIHSVRATSAPTPSSVRTSVVPQLRGQVSQFAAPHVSTVTRQHGKAVLLTYLLDSSPNPVTGKVVRDAAERYMFWQHGQEAVLTLTGPKNADNVDPWRLVSNSLRWG
jgi:hypothetical protein